MKHISANSRTGKHGFTILEVVITLAILGIVTAITLPSMKVSVPSTGNVELEVMKMVGRIAHARNEAVLLGRPVTIKVENNTVTYSSDSTEAGATPSPMVGEGASATTTYVSAGSCTFNASGMVDGSSTCNYVVDDGSTKKTITISGGGYASVN